MRRIGGGCGAGCRGEVGVGRCGQPTLWTGRELTEGVCAASAPAARRAEPAFQRAGREEASTEQERIEQRVEREPGPDRIEGEYRRDHAQRVAGWGLRKRRCLPGESRVIDTDVWDSHVRRARAFGLNLTRAPRGEREHRPAGGDGVGATIADIDRLRGPPHSALIDCDAAPMSAKQCSASATAADGGVAESLGHEDDERILVARNVVRIPRFRGDAVDEDACPCDKEVGPETKQQNDQRATDPSVHAGNCTVYEAAWSRGRKVIEPRA